MSVNNNGAIQVSQFVENIYDIVKQNGVYVSAGKLTLNQQTELAREVFTRLFDGDIRTEPADTEYYKASHLLHGAIDATMNTGSKTANLLESTRGRALTSARVTKQIVKSLKEDFAPIKEEDFSYDFGDGPCNKQGLTKEESDRMKYGSIVSEAMSNAKDTVDEDDKLMRGLFPGRKPGENELYGKPAHVELHKQLMDPRMKELLMLLGDIKNSIKAQSALVAKESMVGTPFSVKPDRDLRRMIPAEKALLASTGLSRLKALKKYVDGQSLCYNLQELTEGSQGDFVILLDTSYSMSKVLSGSRYSNMQLAAAISCAAILSAHEDGRKTRLILYSDHATELQYDLSEKDGDIWLVTKIASIRPDGGTRINDAVNLINEGESVLLICDDDIEISKDNIAKLDNCKLSILSISAPGRPNKIGKEVLDVARSTTQVSYINSEVTFGAVANALQ